MARRALITGVRGQDGHYLARYLLARGYDVVGLSRTGDPDRDPFPVLASNLLDLAQLVELLKEHRPSEVYHLSALSFVPACEQQPQASYSANTLSTLNLLESIRRADPSIRFFLASSSAIFGDPLESPQNEDTPVRPRSHYAITKVAAQELTTCYREAYGLYAVSGILYNHESPRRSPSFLPRKVTQAVAQIRKGVRRQLHLGSLEGGRDWGYAGDTVRAIHGMLQLDHPRDLVVGTGRFRTIEELLQTAFSFAGLDWRRHVVSARDRRPTEPSLALVADAGRARKYLGWEPELEFHELIELMVKEDLNACT